SITRLRPAACYEYIFPKTRFNLDRVSYYFDHDMENTVSDHEYDEIFSRVADWQESWQKARLPYLRYRKSWSSVVIDDGRNGRAHASTYSDGPAAVYEYCADARAPGDISGRFRNETWIEAALNEFLEKDLMIFL